MKINLSRDVNGVAKMKAFKKKTTFFNPLLELKLLQN